MLNIKPGQRWISSVEPELGLGTVLRADNRQVDIIFTGCGELKHFTHAASPLLRVSFECGDLVAVDSRHYRLDGVDQQNGLLEYRCGDDCFIEGVIDPEQPMLPLTLRLLVGQSDAGYLFDLRRQGLQLHALSQEDFELFAISLLDFYGCRLNPVSEHVFLIDASNSSLPEISEIELPCTFESAIDHDPAVVCLNRNHRLISFITAHFLQSHAGNAAFLIDDSLASRSAVLETLFINGLTSHHLTIDALGNYLNDYQPSEPALFRSRGSQTDLKPYKRSLERLYPALLQQAMTHATEADAGNLQALRLVVGSEFALFGKQMR
jgi:hypothetical protein